MMGLVPRHIPFQTQKTSSPDLSPDRTSPRSTLPLDSTSAISAFTRTWDSFFVNDIASLALYLGKMQFESIIRLRKSVGSTSRAAGFYKPR